MKVVIDTSSLISLVRYYLRFDTDSRLYNLFKEKIESEEIIIIDEVLAECKYTSKGIVLDALNYLVDKEWKKQNNTPVNTSSIFPPSLKKFHNIIDNQLIRGSVKNDLDEEEYQIMKDGFMNSADCRMVIYCLDALHRNPDEEILIVTEETLSSNDNKAFKKIPAIGEILKIKVITLPELLEMYSEIDIKF